MVEKNTFSSSDLVNDLYDDSVYYSEILSRFAGERLAKYKNAELQKMFTIIPHKFISICPMALCGALLMDLNIQVSKAELAALGFVMFGISVHDDVVDEMPADRRLIADLLFAGNIVCNEGIAILSELGKTSPLNRLLFSVNQNHFYQHYNIYSLWTKKPSDFSEYLDGLQHDIAFMKIGINYALSIAGRIDTEKVFDEFAINYAFGIQLLDDLREAEKDKKNRYYSYPVIEGHPYTTTSNKLKEYADNVVKSLPDNYIHLKKLADNLKNAVDTYLAVK